MSKRRAKKNKCGWILTDKAATAMIREIESGATATILDRFAGHVSFVSQYGDRKGDQTIRESILKSLYANECSSSCSMTMNGRQIVASMPRAKVVLGIIRKMEISIRSWARKLYSFGSLIVRDSSGFSQPEGTLWVIIFAFFYAVIVNLLKNAALHFR